MKVQVGTRKELFICPVQQIFDALFLYELNSQHKLNSVLHELLPRQIYYLSSMRFSLRSICDAGVIALLGIYHAFFISLMVALHITICSQNGYNFSLRNCNYQIGLIYIYCEADQSVHMMTLFFQIYLPILNDSLNSQ